MDYFDNRIFIFKVALVLAFTFHFSYGFSQNANIVIGANLYSFHSKYTRLAPLNIGDKVPELSFSIVNGKDKIAWLSDYKGKLVILDFWATWCGACISKFPKLDSLQVEFEDQLKIILVNSSNTGDNKSNVVDFIKKRTRLNGKPYNLSIAVNDSAAYVLFPHKEVPHYVWITSGGIVKAITDAKAITEDNIRTVLDNGQINLPVKKDFFSDKMLDLGQDDLLVNDNLYHYSIFKKGKIDNLGVVNRVRIVKNSQDNTYYVRGKAMRNMGILKMYEEAIHYNREFANLYTSKRLILEVNDVGELILNLKNNSKDTWEKANLYTYDLVVPGMKSDSSLYNYILNDLNLYSNYYGRIENRKTKCLVLKRISDFQEKEQKQYTDSTSLTYHDLAWRLDRMSAFKLPIIDGTDQPGTIHSQFLSEFNNVHEIETELRKFGLRLIEIEKVIEVFVITEKKSTSF